MADTTIHIPAEHVPWFRLHVAEELSCDLEGDTPHGKALTRCDLDGLARLVQRGAALLGQLGFPGDPATNDVQIRVDAAYGAYLLDQGLGDLAEDMAVASGEYPNHPLDAEKVSEVSKRGAWLSTVRESIEADPGERGRD